MLLATQQAMAAALPAVDVAYQLMGSSAVYEDDPIGRCHRDLHTARQHIVFSGDWFAEYARDLLGIPSALAASHARAPLVVPLALGPLVMQGVVVRRGSDPGG